MSATTAEAATRVIDDIAASTDDANALMEDGFNIRNLSRAHFDELEAKRLGREVPASLHERARRAAEAEEMDEDEVYIKDQGK